MDTSSGKTRNLVLLSKIILEHPILIELAVIFGTGQGGLRRRRGWRNIIVNRAKWIIRIEGAYILMWLAWIRHVLAFDGQSVGQAEVRV